MSAKFAPPCEDTTEDELIDFLAKINKSQSSDELGALNSQLKALSVKLVTKEMLKATKIGMVIKKLSTLEAPRGDLEGEATNVREIAKFILDNWYKVVKESKKAPRCEDANPEGADENTPKL